ncbi:DnaB-like helicase C-terminal domain-containing protein [Spirosoma pollinicola]|uniref:SF4 helicase domain-containing protein n=1 Tax=Spirosoma pollinicola TaxID=2057025 RepID=A0A2K8ZAX0_9BACT|nr:DnaB-like helicase C-terminal domain-containing protein [Spirosoma pollinicola]AUD07023.1 hypothetical protein CWM47_37500 [Spirosoma pollinicola]
MNATLEENQLDNEIIPALFEVLPEAFPEFGFVRTAKGYKSTTGHKVTNEPGNSKGAVSVLNETPYFLGDFREGAVKGGKAIYSYVKDYYNLPNHWDVVRKLAELAGVSVRERQLTPEQAEQLEKERRTTAVWEATNAYCIDCLSNAGNPVATQAMAGKVRDYLEKERGYTRAEVLRPNEKRDPANPKMELGFFPSLVLLDKYLVSCGFTDSEILTVTSSLKPILSYIETQNRLTFPWRDHIGRIKGMCFRVLNNIQEPKYLYSSFSRGEYLFNLKSVAKDKDLVFVESPLDTLRASVLGITNIVALGGTGKGFKNRTQIDLAIKYGATRITLMLDNDGPGGNGEEGTDSMVAFLQKEYPQLKVWVATYPDGIKDLDQLLTAQGVAGYDAVKKGAIESWYYQLRQMFFRYADRDLLPKEKEDLLEEAIHISAKLSSLDKDQFIREFVSNEYVQIIGISEASIAETVDKIRRAEFEREQSDSLKKLLKEAGETSDTNKALDLLTTKARSIKAKDKADSFAALTRVTSEQQLKERIAARPETLESGYTIMGNPLLISAAAMTILAGATSHGKSILIANMALNMAELYPDKVFHIFSYEIDEDAYLINLLNTYIGDNGLNRFNNRESIEHHFRGKKRIQRKGRFGEPDYSVALFEPGKEIVFDQKRAQFFGELIDKGTIKVHYVTYNSDELDEAIRYLSTSEDIGAIFVDYIQLINLPVGKVRTSSRQEEIKQMCTDFNRVATDTGLPLIFAAQFNREVMNLAQMHASKLGEAGDLERIANQIIGIWNCAKKWHGSPSKSELKHIEERISLDNNGNPAHKDQWYVEVLKARVGKPDDWDIWDYLSNAAKVTSPKH